MGAFDDLIQTPGASPTVDEPAFQRWYADHAQRLGLDANPDAPEHFYDYRAAFANGAQPDATGHWPSEFKREGHPRMVVDGVNTKTGERADNAFGDLIAKAPKKRDVGVGEAAARGVGSGFAEQGNVLGLAGATPAMLADAVRSIFSEKPVTSAQDAYFGGFYEPVVKNAVEHYETKPNENMGTAATVANVGGRVASVLPSAVAAGGGAQSVMLPKIIADLFRGAVAAQPAFAVPSTINRSQQLLEAGVDRPTVAKTAVSNELFNTAMGAAPLSAAGSLLTRATTGAGINVAGGAAQRGAEGAILGEENKAQAQPAIGVRENALDAGIGALMAALLGPRARVPAQPVARPKPTLELEPQNTERKPYNPGTEYDPQAALKAVTENLFRTPEGAPQAPPMQLIPKGHEAPAGRAPEPDVSEVPVKTAPPDVTAVEAQPRQPAREPGYDERGQEIPLHAEEAFRIAESQKERKQGAQDVGGRDLRESRAGGSTSAEGTAATTPEAFSFLDVKRDRAGKPLSTGPEVEILGETTIKQGKKDVPAYKVSYTNELTDGTRERVYEDVAQSRVSQLARPQNPRFAQDIAATTYAPPRGVGTGPEQPKPREAAQRITTEPSPEFIPAERAGQRGEATRAGRDVSDMAFDRIENKGGDHAGDVRGDQRQIGEGRPGQQREVRQSAERGGGNLQLAAPRSADGTGQGGAEHRGPPEGAPSNEAVERDSLAAFEQERDQGFKKSVEGDLRSLAKTAGWSEQGGRLIRDAEGKAKDRTKWVAHEWFQTMRSGLGRKGLSERGQIMLSVEKWLEGEHLNANERRTVNYMVDEVMQLREQADFAGMGMDDARAADVGLHGEGIERTPQNLHDVDYLSRVDPDVLERLALQHGDDTEAFMRAVAKETNGEHQGGTASKDESARADSGGGDNAQPARRPAGDDAGAGGRAQDEGGVREPQRGAEREGGDGGESRPEFDLEHPTEQQLRARDAERQRDEQQRRRVDEAPPPEDFHLTGSERPADEAAARGQDDLFGGGTLAANPFANPKIIAHAVKWAFGDAKAWSESLAELKNVIEDLGKKTKGQLAKNAIDPVRSFARAVFDTAAGDMRAVAKKLGSKTMNDVLDHFQGVAGEGRATKEAFHSAVRSYVNQRLIEMHRMLGDMVNDRDKMKQIANLVRNPAGIKPGTPIHDSAAGIRKMLDATLKYMKDAGVDVGEVKGGYYPREFDIDAVIRNPKAFMDAAAQAYREGGMAADIAGKAARELHDGLLFGETSTLFRAARGATAAPFLKGRVFGKGVDSEAHPLNRFLMSDPAAALGKYFERAAKRAEIARRFGDNFANWEDMARKIVDEGGGAALEKLTDYVTLVAGMKKPGVSNGALRASSVARTWGALMFLSKATLSSLSEFVVPAVRSGNMLDAGRMLKNTLGDLFTKTHSAEERRSFAEDLGLIAGHISSALASARFAGGEPVGRVESQVLDRFFKRTGLNQWTDATRVGAADLARVFIRRLAKDMEKDGNLTKRYLAELGVPAEQAKDFAKYVLDRREGMPVSGDLDGSLGDVYRVAVRKFVAGGIMDPHAGVRPKWMSHPLGAVVGQLQAFNYAFYENVLKRVARLSKDALTEADYTMMERAQMVMPLLTLPLVTAVAFAVGETRDAVFGDPERRAKETGTEKALKAISRGTPIAPIDPFVNYLTAARYGRSFTEAMSGPVFSTAGRVLDKVRDYYLKNSPNTNTQERAAYKAVWDIFIEPTINAMLFASPVSLASAAVTQLAATDTVREKLFVTPIAGEKKKQNERTAGRDAGRSAGRSAGRN